MMQFPQNFFWGAATSAYQVEGNNVNSDWWEWEKQVGLKETSGEACRHYELYRQDFDLAKLLNHNCHRLSIEWSRIEPQEGAFSKEALMHYQDAILALKERNLEPIVTLHHFTNPLWFASKGGWQDKNSTHYFLRYVERLVEVLGDKVNYWITINEPMVYIYHGYILGIWPPQEKSFLKAKRVEDNLISAHLKAYQFIHNIYKKRNLSKPFVSVAQNMQAFAACRPTFRNRFAVYLRNRFFNFKFVETLLHRKALDFVGLNYYTRGLVDVNSWSFKNLAVAGCEEGHSLLKKNSLGWDIYPEGLYHLLTRLKKHNLPIFILENGICTEDDSLRWEFIYEHLKNIYLALQDNVKILGYIYWSLIDNFEWDKGFIPRFGLIEVDYATFERKVRASAKRFSLVCETGRLN